MGFIKKPLRYIRNLYRLKKNEYLISKLISKKEFDGDLINPLDFDDFKSRINGFILSMNTDDGAFEYRYSSSCSKPTLYASAYACMTLSLLGEIKKYSKEAKRKWANYFDSFQSPIDGLFYDPVVINDLYAESDWWGARHLALHMISAYTDLGERPKYEFSFLRKYYDVDYIKSWLDGFDWQSASIGAEDIDNKIMNIGCLLQYQRDSWGDAEAGQAVKFLKKYLHSKINKQTGMWGIFDIDNPHQRSRMVQFAYHLMPIFFYDKDFVFDHEKILEYVLKTQNKYGGYGVQLNSSACEDIDSIEILIRFYPYVSIDLQERIDKSISLALKWVLMNIVNDNGFVFRLNERFIYGHTEMMSKANQGAMFPTWFRTLCLAFISSHFKMKGFTLNSVPGYVAV